MPAPTHRDAKHERASKKANKYLSEVTALQKQMAEGSDLNPLADLLNVALRLAKAMTITDSKGLPDQMKALHAGIQILLRSFVALLVDGRLRLSSDVDEGGAVRDTMQANHLARLNLTEDPATAAVAHWLQARFNCFVLLLTSLLSFDDAQGQVGHEVRKDAFDALISLQVSASSALSKQLQAQAEQRAAKVGHEISCSPDWSPAPWRAWIKALILGPAPLMDLSFKSDSSITTAFKSFGAPIFSEVRQRFSEELLEAYDDSRFATLREITYYLSKTPAVFQDSTTMRSDALQLLVLLTAIPEKQEDLNGFLIPELRIRPTSLKSQKPKKGKRKFTEDGDEPEADEALDDWFSDSDDDQEEEKGMKKRRTGSTNKSTAVLGEVAERANKRSRPKLSKVPFHDAVHMITQQVMQFTNAWLALLLPNKTDSGKVVGGTLSLAQTHDLLLRLHIQILPHLTTPNMLLDWLVAALDSGGATSLLALNALYTLIAYHNLDYPDFYTKLYSLLGGVTRVGGGGSSRSEVVTTSVLHMRYRARFLRLLDTFLASPLLPANMVASFIKRLSRLALRAPPAAVVSVIPLVWTLLKRHQKCMVLIHRNFTSEYMKGEIDRLALGPSGVEDPYDAREPDPNKTGAIDSSLWELSALGASLAAAENQGLDPVAAGTGGQSHYHHSITTLSRILAEPFVRERYNLDDFLDSTYATLFDAQTASILKPNDRRKQPPPAVSFALPVAQLPGQKSFRAFVSNSAAERAVTVARDQQPQDEDARSSRFLRDPLDPMDLWSF